MRKVLPLVLALVLTVPACAPPPPNLTPAATVAFYQTRVQRSLDLIRDTVDDGTKTNPPAFSSATDRKVATWHQSVITVVHDAKAGWKVTLFTSLDQLQNDLSPADREKVLVYISLAKTILQEVNGP